MRWIPIAVSLCIVGALVVVPASRTGHGVRAQGDPTGTPGTGTGTPGATVTNAATVTPTDGPTPTDTAGATTRPGTTTPPVETAPAPAATDDATPSVTPPPETPIVDPDPPLPRPIFLPWLGSRESAALPPPIVAGALGYVVSLNARGRSACAPATHVLLEQTEGSRDNRVVAAVFQDLPDPLLTLDLYANDLVRVAGFESSTVAECRSVVETRRLIGVRTLVRVVRPPGG